MQPPRREIQKHSAELLVHALQLTALLYSLFRVRAFLPTCAHKPNLSALTPLSFFLYICKLFLPVPHQFPLLPPRCLCLFSITLHELLQRTSLCSNSKHSHIPGQARQPHCWRHTPDVETGSLSSIWVHMDKTSLIDLITSCKKGLLFHRLVLYLLGIHTSTSWLCQEHQKSGYLRQRFNKPDI